MKIDMKMEGLNGIVAELSRLPGTNRKVRRQALSDLGKKVVKDLKKTVKAGGPPGTSWAPYSSATRQIARARGEKAPRRPWWSIIKRVKSWVTGRAGRVIVGFPEFIVYLAALQMETGKERKLQRFYRARPGVLKKNFRAFLARGGLFFSGENPVLKTPPRPLFSAFFRAARSGLVEYYKERYHYRLARSMRNIRVS
jgi:hypothetical protein